MTDNNRDHDEFDATELKNLLDIAHVPADDTTHDNEQTRLLKPVTAEEKNPDTIEFEPIRPGYRLDPNYGYYPDEPEHDPNFYDEDNTPHDYPDWEGQSPAPEGFYDEAGSQARADNWGEDIDTSRKGFGDALRAASWAIAAVGVLLIVGLGTFIGTSLGWKPTGNDTTTQAKPTSSPMLSTPAAPTTVPESEAESTPYTSTTTPPPVSWRQHPSRTFAWYGDGLSDVAAKQGIKVGDSSTRYLWNVDPKQTLDSAISKMKHDTQEEKADIFVVSFGSTEQITADQLNRLADATKGRGLVLVGTGTSTTDALPWSRTTNDMLQQLAQKRADTWYVDWQDIVDQDDSMVTNGFILTKDGAQVWSWLINKTVSEAYASLDGKEPQ